jgi:hypothetical protein
VDLVHRNAALTARTLGRPVRPRVIHEDTPHHLRRDPEEMRPVLPRDTLLPDQPEIGLVNECCRLKCVIATLVSQVGGRSPTKLRVDEWSELIARAQVAAPPRLQQGADAGRWAVNSFGHCLHLDGPEWRQLYVSRMSVGVMTQFAGDSRVLVSGN